MRGVSQQTLSAAADGRLDGRVVLQVRRWNLWGYIDARDGAQAVWRALETELPGFGAFIIANADTVMEESSADLMSKVFPNVPLRAVEGTQTLLGIDKARLLLGYEPQHTWRDEV